MFFIPFLLLALGQSQYQAALPKEYAPVLPPADHVLATVNGVPVRGGDVEPMVWQIYHEAIEQEYIDYVTVKLAADKANVAVTDDEAKKQLAVVLEGVKNSLPAGVTITQSLSQQGFSDSRLLVRIRTQLLLEKIEMLQFHQADWVRVSALVYPTPGGKPDIMKSAGNSALSDYDKLLKGASWDALLAHLTTKPDVLKRKGAVGWRAFNDFPALVRDQLQKIKIGEYTHPEQTRSGIEIFRLDQVGPKAAGDDFADLRTTFLENMRKETIGRIKAETKVVKTD
ncbi:MAG TPA: peptidylprolyl isomerase [Fimbriimonadaceae bacterium]|jgi:hypothetical protein